MENTNKEFWQLGREDFLRSIYKSKHVITGDKIKPNLFCKDEEDFNNWVLILSTLLPEVKIPEVDTEYPFILNFITDTCDSPTGNFYSGAYKLTCLYAPKYVTTSYPYQYLRGIEITKPFTVLPDKLLLNEDLEEDKVEQYKQSLINNNL